MNVRWLLSCVFYMPGFQALSFPIRTSRSKGMKNPPDTSCHGSAFRVLVPVASIRILTIILAMLFFAWPSPALAQDPESQLKALYDQWWKIISTYGDANEALRIAQEYLALSEKTHGPNSRQTAAALQELGLSYDGLKDSANALTAYRRALTIYEKIGGRDPNACEVQYQLANDTKDVGESMLRHETGLRCYEAVQSLGKNQAIDHRLMDTVNAYGSHVDLPDVLLKSEQLVQHWLPVVQKQLGPNDLLAAQLLHLQTMVLMARNDFDRAQVTRRQAITIAEKALPSLALDWLDETLNAFGQRPVDAEYMRYAAERAELRTKQYGPNDPTAVANREFLVKARLDNPGVPIPALLSVPPFKRDDAFWSQDEEGDRLMDKAYSSADPRLYVAANSFKEKLLGVAEERFGPFSKEAARQLEDLGDLNRFFLRRDPRGRLNCSSLNCASKAESYLIRAIVTYEQRGEDEGFTSGCYSQANLGKLYAGIVSWQKNRTSEWYGNRALAWYASAIDCYVKTEGPAFDLGPSLFRDYMELLREAHPKQAALLERQDALRVQHATEWQRVLTEANTARRPAASANLDAMIKRIPTIKPETRKK